jgi:hypothetical protein
MKRHEFLMTPFIVWDWLKMFYFAFTESWNPVKSFKFANAMHDNLMECLQENGHFLEE